MWAWVGKLAFWKRRRRGLGVAEADSRPPSLGDVFTPSSPAKRAYVARPVPEADLRASLSMPGTQVIVYGESGAGKSSLVTKVLADLGRRYVTTRCTDATDYEQVLISGFHQLNATARTSQVDSDGVVLKAESTLGGDSLPASVTTGGEWATNRERTSEPIVKAPITAEHLGEAFGRRGYSWVLEDFHKVSDAGKESLAHALKVFSDMGATHKSTQVVVLGAAESPGEVVSGTSNIAGRLSTIEVRPLTDDELGKILSEGERLLKVDFSEVKHQIIRHSVGVASVTHALAFYCCVAAGVDGPSESTVKITPVMLDSASEMFVRSRAADIKVSFDKALVRKAIRKYDNHQIILRALAKTGEAGATHAELLGIIHRSEPDYPAGNLTTYLRELQGDERGALVRRTATGRFRFSTPMQHAYARMHFGINDSQPSVSEIDSDFWTVQLSRSFTVSLEELSATLEQRMRDLDEVFPVAERVRKSEEDAAAWLRERSGGVDEESGGD